MAQPKQKFVFTFPKDEKGDDIKYRFMLTLSKRLSDKAGREETVFTRLQSALRIDGVDGIGVGSSGGYSIEVVIARTFDADEVIREITEKLETEVLSDIIRPKLVV